MITSSKASLPILIIFERHWDKAPKQLIHTLLPFVAQEGYSIYSMETAHNLAEKNIIQMHQETLQFDENLEKQALSLLKKNGLEFQDFSALSHSKLLHLMHLYVSSQRYEKMAEKMRQLPASKILGHIFQETQKLSMTIQGMDIKEYSEIATLPCFARLEKIDNLETYRIATMVENLVKQQQGGKGVVFNCGALHAQNLIEKLTEKNINHLAYFAHSPQLFDDSYDDLSFFKSFPCLQERSFQLDSRGDIAKLISLILDELKLKNASYQEELTSENSHLDLLKNYLNQYFQGFIRPGFYLDALLKEENAENLAEILTKLHQLNIPIIRTTLAGNRYLIIPAVNTSEIAQKLLGLKT